MSELQPAFSPPVPQFSPSYSLNAYCDELTDALERGTITEEQWYEGRRKATAVAYLAGRNPRAQSGSGGDESRWRYTRVSMILEAIDRHGSFLDVGCANGHLVECLQRWVSGSGLNVEFYGVDISSELINLARRRLPDLGTHFFVANAVSWTPPRRFDLVHAHEISYAPRLRERRFFEHLLEDYLTPGGRLIIGPWALHRDFAGMEERIASWGYEPSGFLLKSQGDDPTLIRKMLWFDRI
jgi:SAM-dependent methyltransferase